LITSLLQAAVQVAGAAAVQVDIEHLSVVLHFPLQLALLTQSQLVQAEQTHQEFQAKALTANAQPFHQLVVVKQDKVETLAVMAVLAVVKAKGMELEQVTKVDIRQ
jgi:hypothetical protein